MTYNNKYECGLSLSYKNECSDTRFYKSPDLQETKGRLIRALRTLFMAPQKRHCFNKRSKYKQFRLSRDYFPIAKSSSLHSVYWRRRRRLKAQYQSVEIMSRSLPEHNSQAPSMLNFVNVNLQHFGCFWDDIKLPMFQYLSTQPKVTSFSTIPMDAYKSCSMCF